MKGGQFIVMVLVAALAGFVGGLLAMVLLGPKAEIAMLHGQEAVQPVAVEAPASEP